MSITTPIKPEVESTEEELPVLPKEPEVPDTVVILRKARDYMSQPGKWTTGDLYNYDEGAVCALGAIGYVLNENRISGLTDPALIEEIIQELSYDNLPAVRELVATVNGGIDSIDCGCVASFNDRQTSVHPVIDLYNRTIKRLLDAAS